MNNYSEMLHTKEKEYTEEANKLLRSELKTEAYVDMTRQDICVDGYLQSEHLRKIADAHDILKKRLRALYK